ncbi:FAD-dependent oxidoreductase [Nocardioides dilutus]
MTTRRYHQVVVAGGSVAGLAAAAAAAPYADEVCVVERHAEPGAESASIEPASIVPQGGLPHVLLAGGAAALEGLVPGILGELFEGGAVGDLTGPRPCHWWAFGAVRDHLPDLGAEVPMASRALVETTLRRRVAALPNVTLRNATATGLTLADGGVLGLETAGGMLPADLVVDATGRAARGAEWLARCGVRVPTRERVSVDVSYTAVDVERDPDDLGGGLFAVVQNDAACSRIGVALPAEGDRWQIVLGGYFGAVAEPSYDGMVAFAESLPDPAIATLVRKRWVSEVRRHRFPASERTRWDRAPLPAGHLVVGDAVASFNPIYGQGMSSAIQQAEALATLLQQGRDRRELTRRHARAARAVADVPWRIATGADFLYAETQGSRPPGTDRVNRYLARVINRSADDEVVNVALSRVQNLMARPESLMHPRIAARVLGRRAPERASARSGGDDRVGLGL